MIDWRTLAESSQTVPDKTDKTDKTDPPGLKYEDSEGFDKIVSFGEHRLTKDQTTFLEHVAIQKYDGKLPREWAEAFAKLQFIDRPKQYNQGEWDQVLNDAGLFADKWASQAMALGWSILDVFAVHKSENRRRLDGEGVILSIRGRKVVAVTADHIMIETGAGARQRISRPTADQQSIKTMVQI